MCVFWCVCEEEKNKNVAKLFFIKKKKNKITYQIFEFWKIKILPQLK